MNKLFFLMLVSFFLVACSSFDNEKDYDQTVVNNSSFDVSIANVSVPSGNTIKISKSYTIDDNDELLSLTSTDYPRVEVTRKYLGIHRYLYTITDYDDSFEYYDTDNEQLTQWELKKKEVSITNTSTVDIKVFNPYFYSAYKGENENYVLVPAKSSSNSNTVTVDLYNDYTTFTAFYCDEDNDSSNDISASVEFVKIRYTVADDVTDSNKRKGNGHIIGYKVIVK